MRRSGDRDERITVISGRHEKITLPAGESRTQEREAAADQPQGSRGSDRSSRRGGRRKRDRSGDTGRDEGDRRRPWVGAPLLSSAFSTATAGVPNKASCMLLILLSMKPMHASISA